MGYSPRSNSKNNGCSFVLLFFGIWVLLISCVVIYFVQIEPRPKQSDGYRERDLPHFVSEWEDRKDIAVKVVAALPLLMLPTIVAFCRGHHNAGAIAATNILLGVTGIGWIVAMIWAFTATGTQQHTHRHYHYHD